jgi:hypothetical protein
VNTIALRCKLPGRKNGIKRLNRRDPPNE